MSVPTVTILSEGRAIDPVWELVSVEVRREVGRVPSADLAFVDGDIASGEFPLSDSEIFKPGAQIEIKVRYEGDPGTEVTVFKGLVVRHAIEAGGGSIRLSVELKDAAFRLTQVRKSRVFAQVRDDEMMAKVLRESGLRVGKLENTRIKQEQIVQYRSTDWDFLVSRAELFGLAVVADDGTISTVPLKPVGAPKVHVRYGLDEVYNFEMQVDGNRQFTGAQGLGWDVKKHAVIETSQKSSGGGTQGKSKSAEVAKALGVGECLMSHVVPVSPEEVKAWTAGRLTRGDMSLLRGRVAVPGLGSVKLLDMMELTRLGKRFNGKALVTGIRHRVDEQVGWQTDVQFGLNPRRFCEEDAILEPRAAGVMPAVSGLQIGIVTQIHDDPDKLFRLKLKLPALGSDGRELWARLAVPEAGKERGWFFFPEVNDEVLVGFLDDDPRQPVVLGSMYGTKNTPASEVRNIKSENPLKGIFTRAGTKILFNDKDKPAVSIETKGGNKLMLDDEAKSVKISDANGNTLTLDDKGITVKTGKDLILEATGKVEIKGSKVDVK